jgi:subtilisin family serine protease
MMHSMLEVRFPMALKSLSGFTGAALAVLLAGTAPEIAQAAPIPGTGQLHARTFIEYAMFRNAGPGKYRFRAAPSGSRVHPRGSYRPLPHRRHEHWTGSRTRTDPVFIPRHPPGGGGSNLAGVTGRDNGPVRDPHPPRHPPVRIPGLLFVPVIPPPGETFTILGSGGTPRPPIAPFYGSGPGQNPAQAAAALLNNKRHRPRELLAEVGQDTPESVKQDLARQYGADISEVDFAELTGVRIWHFTLRPDRDLRQTLIALLQDRRIMSVQPNYIYTPVQGKPQDERSQEGQPAPRPDGAEATPPPARQTPNGAGIKLAVIDTCIEASHDELKGSVSQSFSALQQGATSCNPENHGTAVASLIAGHGKLQGTAEGASLLAAQAFTFSAEDNEVDATTREIWMSIVWAAKAGAQVMNLSFAGPSDPEIERAVATVYRKGITLVAAAGNAGPSSPPLYPAAYPEVIAVTATDGRRGIYSAANRGKYISVSARGVDVLAAHVNNTYGMESGTSFAAAEVSGIVASILEKRPNASPDEIRAALQKTAAAIPGAGKEEAGFGEADLNAALAFAEASPQ